MKLNKTYDPNQSEPTIYAMWESSSAFMPTPDGEPYSIVMPPPNANGNLHIGHAYELSLKDVFARFYRMMGKSVIYIPGADHAGFETWVVYEKELTKQGRSRFDFTREQLYSQVWNFVHEQRGSMELQMRALGLSVDWSSLVFTLDKKVIDTTHQIFKRLWDDGLVYRGERIVNYCTVHQTSFADIEVEYAPEKGSLWKIAYPTLDKIGEIVVATTRPETMLGDTAIAVHPDDPRYKDLIGTRAMLPLADREIPIIADPHVDPNFGTGAVKITPAHDPNDFEIGVRHNLPYLQVIGFDGTMINVPPQFMGLDILSARKRILAALQASELFRGEEPIEHSVGHCYKCGTIIQPLIKDQWFISVQPLAEKAIANLETDQINFTPDSKKRVIIQYLKGLRDWNISRQIPWGIPIPAFQNINDSSDWIFDTRVDETTIVVNDTTYRREEDTFDTWFSSGQWPYIVTDYLQKGDLARFYPTSLMETGVDLIDRWVARMIMLGLYATEQVPFKHVYLHGMVLDANSQKMSKSKGNVINPMESITKYGSDALRIGLLTNRSPGQSQAFSDKTVIAGRNFANKLWNIARYIETRLGEGYKGEPAAPKSLADHWIVQELNQATKQIDEQIIDFRISEAVETMYHTIWGSVADWYVEASKSSDNLSMMAYVLETSLKIAHPFAPFVTETIWQTLWWRHSLLISEKWPEPLSFDHSKATDFEKIQSLTTEIRFILAEVPKKHGYELLHPTDDMLIKDNQTLIKHFVNLKSISENSDGAGLRIAGYPGRAWLNLDDKTLDKYKKSLSTRYDEAKKQVELLKSRLNNPGYMSKAPEVLINETKQQLEAAETMFGRLETELAALD